MKQFVIDRRLTDDGTLVLVGNDFHYLVRVRRLNVGDVFRAIGADGITAQCIVESVGTSSCTVRVNALDNRKREFGWPRITLYQCFPKGGRFDSIARQATECGISALVPVRSQRVVADVPDERVAKRLERWRRIVREAVQQSGAPSTPRIESPIVIEAIPTHWANRGAGLVFHHDKLDSSAYLNALTQPYEEVAVCVGPEGGLTDREVEFLVSSGFTAIYLGNHVLRTDTAALYAIASVQVYLRATFHKVQQCAE